MPLRIKYWYILTGANGIVTLLAAAGHILKYVGFSFGLTVGCWYMAEYLLNKWLEEICK